MKNEIQEKDDFVMSTEVVLDFEQDAGMGLEGADKNSYAIPFIKIIQALSPEIETIEGAKPGMFINTITGELMKEVNVVPCFFQRRFLRWAPRSEGSGYKGNYTPAEVEAGKLPCEMSADGKMIIEGDTLMDTRNHYVLMKDKNGSWQTALVSMSSTQIKKSKRWMSRILGIEFNKKDGGTFNPPSFSHIYKLKSVKEENSLGHWWAYDIDLVSPIEDAQTYQKAKAFYETLCKGEFEVQQPVNEETF